MHENRKRATEKKTEKGQFMIDPDGDVSPDKLSLKWYQAVAVKGQPRKNVFISRKVISFEKCAFIAIHSRG